MSTWHFFTNVHDQLLYGNNFMDGLIDNKVKNYYYKYKTVDY